ncbi:type I polyketide synthase, partial [Nocardia panacis]|uniref:type I polyketide synthase n=1 Tax=Nocardia panacis TaxID=2340916 RepID=UPI003F72D14C
MGHTQAAAGVAGVIKMVMAMRHGVLPPTLHADEPTPHVDWSSGGLRLLTESTPWGEDGRTRRAAVSSFGISGTNAHVILEQAPALEGADSQPNVVPVNAVNTLVPLLISAKNKEGLEEQAQRLRSFLSDQPELDLGVVAYALANERAVFEYRAVVLGADRSDLLAGLETVAAGGDSANVVRGQARGGKVAFVFPGQGAQWAGMGAALLDFSPVFAEQVRACAAALAGYVDWSLEDALRQVPGAADLDRVDVVQPLSFAVMVSLAALWRSYGVEPSMVVGHSQGEIAAAYVAGALSLEDAARVVALRSKALLEVSGRGGMVAVSLPVEQLADRIRRWGEAISIAALNGPGSVVVSGEVTALGELLESLEADGVHTREIPVDYASHSAQMETIRDTVIESLAPIRPRLSVVPFYSTVTGGLFDTNGLTAEYWYRSLRQTVLFQDATAVVLGQGCRALIEVSSHPVLKTAVQATIEVGADGDAAAVLGSLRRDDGGLHRFATSLAEAFTCGVGVDWGRWFGPVRPGRVELPGYAFQHRRFWLGSRSSAGDAASVGLSRVDHPFVGAGVALGDGRGWLFTGRLSLQVHGWLADHAVLGTVLFPGTGFLEWAFAAGGRVGAEVVEDLTVQAPLVLAEHGAVQMQLCLGEADAHGRRPFDIYSRPESSGGTETGPWTHHATGVLSTNEVGGRGSSESLAQELFVGSAWPPAGAVSADIDALYERLAGIGVVYGPAFQGLRAAWRRGEEVFAEVEIDQEHAEESRRFGLHPALFDSAFHVALDVLGAGDEPGRTPLLFSWSRVTLHVPGATRLRVRVVGVGADGYRLTGWDDSGELVVTVETLIARPVDTAALAIARGNHEDLYRLGWEQLDPQQIGGQQIRAGSEGNALRVAVIEQTDHIASSTNFTTNLTGDLASDLAADCYADVGELVDAVAGGLPVPDVVVVPFTGAFADGDADLADGGLVSVVKANTYGLLGL